MSVVVVDAAGGPEGGAARFKVELRRYMATSGRTDLQIIGMGRRVEPAWLLRRETSFSTSNRRVALNNISFVTPGSERWALLRNPLDFLTKDEDANLDPGLRALGRRRIPVVHLAARRADVLVVPSAAMAKRVARTLPRVASRIVVRHHPVSADSIPRVPRESFILCPVLFTPYKHMISRLREWVAANDGYIDSCIRMLVTAEPAEVPGDLAAHPLIKLVGRIPHAELRMLWARSRAIFFPSALESFGFPLAEARVNGQPVIACDSELNQEVAGPALCGYTISDADSLRSATQLALYCDVAPDPAPFDPKSYFDWLLGEPQ
jgi:glycosyltransferase involved in cell wall biosynthesis